MIISIKIPAFIKSALYSPKKFVIIVAGRRTGKTYNTVQWLIDGLLKKPNQKGLHVDTTQSNISKYVDRYYKPILKDVWHLCSWNQQKYILTLPNGSYIDFGSAERPENLEGFEYDFILLNEGGIILKRPGIWNNSILPMTKGPHTKVRIVGTPKGKGLFHELYVRGQTDQEGYASFRFTSYDSPFWDPKELDQIKTQVPQEVFNQEFLADFLENVGSVFRNIGACIRESKSTKGDIMSVDLAKYKDFTVVMIGDSNKKQVTHIDRFNEIDWPFQKKRIYNLWKQANQPQMILDSTGIGDAIYDDLSKAGVTVEGFKFTNESKKELIQNLSIAIDNKEIFYPPDKVLLNELEIFGYELSPMGNIRYNAPEGFHDDCVISLALLNRLMHNSIDIDLSFI